MKKQREQKLIIIKNLKKEQLKKIQQQLVKHLKLRNNGIKFAKMYVLKHTKIPGVLIEPCFYDKSIRIPKIENCSISRKHRKRNSCRFK